MNKFTRLANYFDNQGFYKSADAIDSFIKKAQGLSFVDKQPDLAKIEKSNKIANDIVYYAASVSQGTKTPSYDPKSFFTTIQKIESMKTNPDVEKNFPNIYNALDSAIELLKQKSLGTNSGSGIETKPGQSPESAPVNPQNPNTPTDATKEDIEFVRKTISNMKRYIGDLKRWRSQQKLPAYKRDKWLSSDEKVQERITAYSILLENSIKILRSEKYRKAVQYLVFIGEFNPDTDIPSTESISPDAPVESDLEFIRKTYIDMKRFARYDIPRHQRDLELLNPESEQKEIRKKKQIINNYLALIDKAKLTLSNPKYKKAVDELIKRGEISVEDIEDETPSDASSTLPGGAKSEAGKIVDEAFPTYSSRSPKKDDRLPGNRSRQEILFDYFNNTNSFDPNEKDPAGGPKLDMKQLKPPGFSFSLPGIDNSDKPIMRYTTPVKF